MHINREARDVAPSLYEKIQPSEEKRCPMLINFDLDTLCGLRCCNSRISYVELNFSCEAVSRIRHLAVEYLFINDITRDERFSSELKRNEGGYQFLRKLEKLEGIDFVRRGLLKQLGCRMIVDEISLHSHVTRSWYCCRGFEILCQLVNGGSIAHPDWKAPKLRHVVIRSGGYPRLMQISERRVLKLLMDNTGDGGAF
jgi:hypothetical protein